MTIAINDISSIKYYSLNELKNDPKIQLGTKTFTVTVHNDKKISVSRSNASAASALKHFFNGNTTAKKIENEYNNKFAAHMMMGSRPTGNSSSVSHQASQIDLDKTVKKTTQETFNTHVAPGGTLMSTCRPAGDLQEYARMLKNTGVSVLISLDHKAPNAITTELNKLGIEHINEETFYIEDFFGNGELPRNKLKNITNLIKGYESEGKKVAIHCGAGDGRSGMVKSAYLLSKLPQLNGIPSNNTFTDTHYDSTDYTKAAKEVHDAINEVRNHGHKNAVERPEDVYALQSFYASLLTA